MVTHMQMSVAQILLNFPNAVRTQRPMIARESRVGREEGSNHKQAL